MATVAFNITSEWEGLGLVLPTDPLRICSIFHTASSHDWKRYFSGEYAAGRHVTEEALTPDYPREVRCRDQTGAAIITLANNGWKRSERRCGKSHPSDISDAHSTHKREFSEKSPLTLDRINRSTNSQRSRERRKAIETAGETHVTTIRGKDSWPHKEDVEVWGKIVLWKRRDRIKAKPGDLVISKL